MSQRPRKGDSKYQQYLASREWGMLREAVRRRSGNVCEHCFVAPQQAVHHLSYENLYNEKLYDLLAICNECHEFVSGLTHDNPLDKWAIVTEPIQFPFFERMGFEPYHYLVPSQDRIDGSMLPMPEKGFVVRRHPCRGDGCIWCTYIFADWPIYFTDLRYTGRHRG